MVEWRFDLYYRAALGMPAGQLGRAVKARLRFCETLETGGASGPAARRCPRAGHPVSTTRHEERQSHVTTREAVDSEKRRFGPVRLGYHRAICIGDRYQITAGGGY